MLDPKTLLDWPFKEIVQTYTRRDMALYALGVGYGADPIDEGQLRFVREEDNCGVPTMPACMCLSPPWSADPRSGVNRTMIVHGEQGLELLRPMPASGTFRSLTRITDIVDKGPGRGAVVYAASTLIDDATDEPVAHLWRSTVARADGGFGGSPVPPRVPHKLPDRAPDTTCTLPTFPNQALLYRANGDLNPLHSHPDAARAAGFDRPILHGLATYGLVGHAVLRAYCNYDPSRLRALDVRFSAPVYPGEIVTVDLWRDAETVSFRAVVEARATKVIDNGKALLG